MNITDYSASEIKILFLTHSVFRKSPYWVQVRNLVDKAYKRDRLPGESLNTYRKAFMRGIEPGTTKRKHFLIIHEPTGTVITHHNCISTFKPYEQANARLGHMVILSNVTIDGKKLSLYHLDDILLPFLRSKGFKKARGSHYSIIGAVLGENKGFKGYAVTERGEKYLKLARELGFEGYMSTIRGKKYGPEMFMHYVLRLG